ncbi:MAG: transglutaminase domain-containing protein [Christensenellaceae bacterium]
MSIKVKNKTLAILVVVLSLFVCLFVTESSGKSKAYESVSFFGSQQKYYQSQLEGSQLVFYNALVKMDDEGRFMRGENYLLTDRDGVNSLSGEIDAYLNGDGTLMRNFVTALNSFRFDNCHLFFVDFEKVELNVYQSASGYSLQIGAGREKTYLLPQFAETDVSEKVFDFNHAVTTFVSDATVGLTDTESKIKAINNALLNAVELDFLGEETTDEKYETSAYSAIIDKKATSCGFSELFGLCMEELGVDCVKVFGKVINGGKIYTHYWNNVKLGDKWLGVDVATNKTLANSERFLLCDSDDFTYNHYPVTNVVSGAGELQYPELYKDENKFTTAADPEKPNYSSITPKSLQTEVHAVGFKYMIILKFDTAMTVKDESLPVVVNYTYQTYDGEVIDEQTLRTSTVLDQDSVMWLDVMNTLSFNFTASDLYEHNAVRYTFSVENLVSAENGLSPVTFSGTFARRNIYSDVITDNSQLYETVIDPTLKDNTRLDIQGWEYVKPDNSKGVVNKNQLESLMLIGSTDSEVKKHYSVINGLNNNSLVSASAVGVDLYLCGYKAVIPQNKSLKVTFGFPENCVPTDNLTFKIYSYSRTASGDYDYDNPVEIPCVVTRYGITVEIESEGLFVACAFNADNVKPTKKSVNCFVVDGLGTINQNSNGEIFTLGEGESATLNFEPESGFVVEYALINGVETAVENNAITISYQDLSSSNTVAVSFAESSVLAAEQAAGVANVKRQYLEKALSKIEPKSENSSDALRIKSVVIVGLCAFLIVSLAVVIIVFAIKNNKDEQAAAAEKNGGSPS